MEIPFIIDKETYTIMKYIYRHKEVKLCKISNKFGEDAMIAALYLCPQQYAAYRDESKHITFDITHTSANGSIGLTPLGNKYVEDRREAFIKWYVPLVTSSISVAISMMALATSIFLK
ncbi:MAG: hypothetical protein Q4E91_01565 [Lachnospiraceae bacterium]|nr:hypothetical protein [Lachnospiraceae bacterium]